MLNYFIIIVLLSIFVTESLFVVRVCQHVHNGIYLCKVNGWKKNVIDVLFVKAFLA